MDDLTKEFLAESQEGLERMERCLTELERHPGDCELVSEVFRSVHTIKGATGFLGFERLERLAHAGEGLLGAVRDGKVAANSAVIGGLLRLMDGLRLVLGLIEQTGAEGMRSSDDDSELIGCLTDLKAGGGRLAAVERGSGRGAEGSAGAATVGETTASRTGDAVVPGEGASGSTLGPVHDRTLRIDVEVLNRMMNQVGELVLTRNRILQSEPGAKDFAELARRLDTVTAELRESVMQARMQPVGHLFSKFPRMVRDLARACGRQARIEFEGQETGLDKSLLEAIRDPLTHMVRNAVDHGIEPPEIRVAVGKAAEGLVRLRAFHHGGSVVIEVMDDGAGIPTKLVLAKAVERGLLTTEQAERMSEGEAQELIFLPGFSTVDEVTNVSGRGVGMDVVRANVEHVGGSVEMDSATGVGTTVRLRVPLTLAIVPALVVRSGGQRFALPQNTLMELVHVSARDTAGAVERMGQTELYRLREGLLPLVRLDRVLGFSAGESAAAKECYIAVVEAEGCRFGLAVEELLEPEEIVVKPLSAVLRGIGVFSGATVLGNGTLAMILDVAAMGARAGVRPMAADAARVAAARREAACSEELGREKVRAESLSEMVVYETGRVSEAGERERMAMPLRLVERIETVELGRVSSVDGRAVMQYRGELLALEDDGGALRELVREAGSAQGGAMVTVLICVRAGAGGAAGTAEGAKRLGIVVRRVLDITAASLLESRAEIYDGELAMVKDRVMAVHREFLVRPAGEAAAKLQEVA